MSMRKRTKSRSYFLLIEVMIACALVALIASVLSFRISSLLHTYRFQGNIETIVSILQEAKMGALCCVCDIDVDIVTTKQGAELRVRVDEPTLSYMNSCRPLKEITRCFVKKKSINQLTIHISSLGHLSLVGEHLDCIDLIAKHSKTYAELHLRDSLHVRLIPRAEIEDVPMHLR